MMYSAYWLLSRKSSFSCLRFSRLSLSVLVRSFSSRRISTSLCRYRQVESHSRLKLGTAFIPSSHSTHMLTHSKLKTGISDSRRRNTHTRGTSKGSVSQLYVQARPQPYLRKCSKVKGQENGLGDHTFL